MLWWKRRVERCEEPASPWISDEAAAAIRKRHGAVGEVWLRGLEVALADAAVRHGVVLEGPVGTGSTSAVVRASSLVEPERRIILKASPDEGMLQAEAAALRAWGSPHAVAVLEDVRGGVLVLEHVEGGAENGELPDDTAVTQIGEVLGVIARTPVHGYTLHPGGVLTKACERLSAHSEELSERVEAVRGRIEEAVALRPDAQLCGLHGDLHSENTLRRGDQLVMIDPFPITGPLSYDLGFWASDPMREGSCWDRVRRLGARFALSEEELWGYSVLGALQHLTYRSHYQVDLQRVTRAEEIVCELLDI